MLVKATNRKKNDNAAFGRFAFRAEKKPSVKSKSKNIINAVILSMMVSLRNWGGRPFPPPGQRES
jgi:hypothetical protein